MAVKRIFVEKKPGFDVEAVGLAHEIKGHLGTKDVKKIRILYRYDIEGITDEIYDKACTTIFSEPPVDNFFNETFDLHANEICFAIEYLPGQYDQRADSAAQCIQILTEGERPIVKHAKVIVIEGSIGE